MPSSAAIDVPAIPPSGPPTRLDPFSGSNACHHHRRLDTSGSRVPSAQAALPSSRRRRIHRAVACVREHPPTAEIRGAGSQRPGQTEAALGEAAF